MDELADVRLIEFRDNPAHIGVVAQRFHTREDLAQQPNTDIGHALFGVPAIHGFEISDGRLGESNDEPGHVRLGRLFQAEADLRLNKGQVPAGFNVSKTGNHGPHERPLLFGRFILRQRLNYGDASSTTRKQDRPASLRCVLDDPPWIDFQVGEGNHVLRKSGAHGGLLRCFKVV
jgi:hypothetical protein